VSAVADGTSRSDLGAGPGPGDRAYTAANGYLLPFGGGDFRTVYGSPGTILDPATFEPAYAIPNQNGQSLTVAELIRPRSARCCLCGVARRSTSPGRSSSAKR
jgi:hypothetical protein